MIAVQASSAGSDVTRRGSDVASPKATQPATACGRGRHDRVRVLLERRLHGAHVRADVDRRG